MRRLLAFAATLVSVVALALPAGADTETATTAAAIAQKNASAIAAERAQIDNISCTIGAFTAVNQPAVDRPGVAFIYGRDLAASNGACVNIDLLAPQDAYDAVLRTHFQYLPPGSNANNDANWVTYRSSRCQAGSTGGQSAIGSCSAEHSYTSTDDPIQRYQRRAHFVLETHHSDGRVVVRSERYFGPILDSKKFLATINWG